LESFANHTAAHTAPEWQMLTKVYIIISAVLIHRSNKRINREIVARGSK